MGIMTTEMEANTELPNKVVGMKSQFYILAGNPIKEILLKLNLPDHRKLKDGGVPDSSCLTRFIATCSYPTDKHKDIMKAQPMRFHRIAKVEVGKGGVILVCLDAGERPSVNDTLTAELERYKEQVKVLNEGQNVDLRSNNNVSDLSAQSIEIDRLNQTLSKHLKEKESLMQTVSLLKDDFKKEELGT
ncbi:hypothetical protein Tco_0285225 [Tanacetum coccineum]